MGKLLRIYEGLTKPAKASIWFIVSNVLIKGISFFTLPIFSHLLTTAEYGVVSVYNSWVTTISILTTLTIWGGVFNVGMAKFSTDSRRLISSFQGLAVSITVVALIGCLMFIKQISLLLGLSHTLTICVFLEILTQIPFNIWATEQRYKYEYRLLILITLIVSLLSPMLGIFAVTHSSYRAEAKIISNLIVNGVVGGILFFTNEYKGKTFFNKEYWAYGFKFNIVLVPHYLSTQILNQADRIMINAMCGNSDAGIYSMAYNFALLLSLVTNGINSSLTPYIYQCLKADKTSKLRKLTTSIVLIAAVMSAIFICFIPDLFYILLPESYFPALKVIPPVTVGAFFMFLYPMFGSIEFYYEETKYVTYASVIGAGTNVVLNYIFIKWFGFIAAAYTTLICYIGFCVCHYKFMIRILNNHQRKNDIYDTKKISFISINLIIFSLVMVVFYDYTLLRWTIILLLLLLLIAKKNLILSILMQIKER